MFLFRNRLTRIKKRINKKEKCICQVESLRGLGHGLRREVFFLNLEDGYFGCQVNESTEVLQLLELSKLCDNHVDCYQGTDEQRDRLKCTGKPSSTEIPTRAEKRIPFLPLYPLRNKKRMETLLLPHLSLRPIPLVIARSSRKTASASPPRHGNYAEENWRTSVVAFLHRLIDGDIDFYHYARRVRGRDRAGMMLRVT